MNNYIIYTRPDCGYCDRAKALIEQKGHTYTEVVLGSDISKEELFEMFPDVKTVPVVVLDGKKIGGYQELTESVKQMLLKG
jgi:glutaredoxin 3